MRPFIIQILPQLYIVFDDHILGIIANHMFILYIDQYICQILFYSLILVSASVPQKSSIRPGSTHLSQQH